jgi:hypothetical protein
MKFPIPHPRRLLLFALLSVADLSLTCCLLQATSGQVYESNPLAGWCLSGFGWSGLAFFKLAAVFLVVGLVVVICRYQPRRGGHVLTFACTAVGGVLFYSCFLAGCVLAESGRSDLARERARHQDLRHRLQLVPDYRRVLNKFSAELIDRPGSLGRAVTALAATRRGQDDYWLRTLRGLYPGCSDRECLAASLIEYTVGNLPGDLDKTRRVGRRLLAAFQTLFGRPPPAFRWALARK